ncbi:Uncharacterised protein [Helicobacter pametensis]|nr:Uncharacterised protein [Helicobacter pametensis]
MQGLSLEILEEKGLKPLVDLTMLSISLMQIQELKLEQQQMGSHKQEVHLKVLLLLKDKTLASLLLLSLKQGFGMVEELRHLI